MADSKITSLTEITVPHSSDVLPIVDISGYPTTKKVTVTNLRKRVFTIKTSSYTAEASDDIIICNSSTAMTIDLPAATGSGQVYSIKNINTGVVTVDGASSDTIDGETTQTVNQWDAISLVDYAANKWIIN